MATQTQERDTLEQLQSSKQVALLDAIDKLRSKVSLHDISFPQLIVCGDQSSGKSSVLEGLTRLSFPTKEGTCTTFATEVALRKEAVVEISCSIRPGRNRSPAQIRELSKFKRSFSALKDFSFTALVEEAQEQMRFGASSNGTKFFDDVLTVRYVGPDVPSLTIVDLPGLIQAGIGEDHSQSVEQVHGLVDRYMQDEKSIILAVVSARNDLNNQAVFRKVETVDPKGHRSLGIITKPDLLDVGSETEAKFLKLAQNEVMPLELGWHVVKNRGFGESDLDAAGRDRNEREFFAKSAWKSLLPSDVGIDALRSKLSEVLLRHICKELPTITASIREAITATETRISKLGEPRESQEAQRLYLTKNSERFQKLTDNALGGIYNDRFFALSSVHGHGAARLRTEIQNLNIAFAYVMYRKGHAWNIKDDPNVIDVGSNPFVSNATQQYEAEFDDPEQVTRADFLQNKIGNYVRESRPSGLPSLVNPWVIGEIFRDQSEPWADIAKYHLERVFQAVKEYTHIALESLMDSRTYNMILLEQVDPELESRKKAVEEKLEELLTPYREQDPTTYDPSFVFELNAIRAKRYKSAEASGPFAIGQMRSSSHGNSKPLLLTETIDDYTNSEIMDLMQVYYRKAISVFISNVTVLAVENCLMSNLVNIFSPSLVSSMSPERLEIIASESEEIRNERAALKQRLADLKAGKRVLDVHICDTRSALPTPSGTRGVEASPRRNRHSRSRTPTPQRQPESTDPNVESLSSSFGQLLVTPPREGRPSPNSRRPAATPEKRSNWSFGRRALESDTEEEEPLWTMPPTISARA